MKSRRGCSIEKYLRGTAFQAVAARNLREGRMLLETLRPAALILDIMLRGEDGWSLLPELKSTPETSYIPVLVITNLDDRDKAMSLGATRSPGNRWSGAGYSNTYTSHRAGRPRKILVIDDEEVSRYLLRQLFPPRRTRLSKPLWR